METAVEVAHIFSGYVWWQTLIVIGVAFLGLFILLMVAFKLFGKDSNTDISFMGLKLSNKKDKIPTSAPTPQPVTVNVNTFSNDDDEGAEELEEINDEPKVTLQSCLDQTPSFSGELLLIVSRSIRFGRETTELELKLIRSQMNNAQVKADAIKNVFLKEYTNKTLVYKQMNKYNPNSYDIFSEFISRVIRNKILDEFRRAFKENHLQEYTDESFEEYYCRAHIRNIMEGLRLEIMNIMPDCILPNLDDIIYILDKNETIFYSYLKEVLYDARTLVIKNSEELRKRTAAFDKEILESTGLHEVSKRVK